MPAVTGRTRRRFAPALGSGKAAGRCKTACTTRKIRGGSLLYKAPHPVCLPHGFVQDEVKLFIAQVDGEVKREFLGKASLVKGRWPEGPEGFRRALPCTLSHPQTGRNPSASQARHLPLTREALPPLPPVCTKNFPLPCPAHVKRRSY